MIFSDDDTTVSITLCDTTPSNNNDDNNSNDSNSNNSITSNEISFSINHSGIIALSIMLLTPSIYMYLKIYHYYYT